MDEERNVKPRSRAWRAVPLAPALLVSGWLAARAVERPDDGAAIEPPWSGWSTLTFRARSAPFLSGRVRMELRQHGGKTLFETETSARFLGATLHRSRTRTVIDPASGRTEEYLSLSPKGGRRYVFDDRGYVLERLRSAEGYAAPIEHWEVTSRKEFSLSPAQATARRGPIYDYYGMLLRLRNERLREPGDEIVVTVATSRGPAPYVVRVAEARTGSRTYRDLASGELRTAAAREFLLAIHPAVDEASDEGFLGMRGETRVWVEAETKTLLQVDGKVPKVPGRVVIELADIGS
jgi:hypothetical protein